MNYVQKLSYLKLCFNDHCRSLESFTLIVPGVALIELLFGVVLKHL